MTTDSRLLALAEALGAQALVWFFVVLFVSMALAAIAWLLARRFLGSREPDTRASPLQVVLRIAVGFAVIVGAALGFAELAEEIGEDDPIVGFDEQFSRSVGEGIGPAALRCFAALTRLGDTLTLTLLCIAVAAWLLMRGRRGLALGWIIAVAGNGLLNQTLKQVFERVRPLHEHGLVQAQGWSFPSGHSSGSVVAYGMLAYVLIRSLPSRWHLPIILLATAISITVGSSRVFLQVHFPSDVLAGFLSGLAWLAVCVASVELARRYRGR